MEKSSRHDDEDQDDDFTPAMVPVASDGGIDPKVAALAVGSPSPAPPRTTEHFVCMRGPCRHYWRLVTMTNAGNPEGTWEALGIAEPRQHHHTCLVNPGYETDFGDDNAFECNKWDPLSEQELVTIRTHREAYYEKHPEHRPVEKESEDGEDQSA